MDKRLHVTIVYLFRDARRQKYVGSKLCICMCHRVALALEEGAEDSAPVTCSCLSAKLKRGHLTLNRRNRPGKPGLPESTVEESIRKRTSENGR